MKNQLKIIKITRYRRSDTGHFCTKKYAQANPSTTQKYTILRRIPLHSPVKKILIHLELT